MNRAFPVVGNGRRRKSFAGFRTFLLFGCGRRIDTGFAEILIDNPCVIRRAQVLRRGRVGETNQARDMATEGWVRLANGGAS
jgi:hypothetical protein